MLINHTVRHKVYTENLKPNRNVFRQQMKPRSGKGEENSTAAKDSNGIDFRCRINFLCVTIDLWV